MNDDLTAATEQRNDFDPPEVVRERLRKDPRYLPTYRDIVRAFAPTATDPHLDKLYKFCVQDPPIYEVLNRDHLRGLAKYLKERGPRNKEGVTTILEVGAGNGRLSHFLGTMLEALSPGEFKVIATDDKSGDAAKDPPFPVEAIDYQDAVTKYQPTVIVSSWMPYKKDWTPAFREAQSVKAYILIGETGGGCVGGNATWGHDLPDYTIPDYEKGGFEQKPLSAFVGTAPQACRTDYFISTKPPILRHSSDTTIFRRINATPLRPTPPQLVSAGLRK